MNTNLEQSIPGDKDLLCRTAVGNDNKPLHKAEASTDDSTIYNGAK